MRCFRNVGLPAVVAVLACAAAPRIAFAQPAPASSGAPAPAPAPTLPPPSAAVVPQTAPAASPVPAPTPEEIRHRRVVVDVESTLPSAVVERRVSITESEGSYFFLPFGSRSSIWEEVCVSPCQVDLDRFSTYRVSPRNGISGSRSFSLPQQNDQLTLKIDAGNLLAHRAGAALSGAGLAAVIVGVALVAGEGIFTDEDKARTAGFITGGAGIVVLAVGIPLALLTSTTVSGPAGKIALTPRGLAF
ncbi:MAG TPA: hypothetical protein VK762_29360 [Polyangiaceae bacterium]|jgi:hypothetical protein|nr:hypothetical protein [Polyangiaceae bacterium]